jgi:hypothetical protein
VRDAELAIIVPVSALYRVEEPAREVVAHFAIEPNHATTTSRRCSDERRARRSLPREAHDGASLGWPPVDPALAQRLRRAIAAETLEAFA